jgi:hypothetical protein
MPSVVLVCDAVNQEGRFTAATFFAQATPAADCLDSDWLSSRTFVVEAL